MRRTTALVVATAALTTATAPVSAQSGGRPIPYTVSTGAPATTATAAPAEDAAGTPVVGGPDALSAADARNLARAKAVFLALEDGKVDRSQLTSGFDAELTAEEIAQASRRFKPFGPPESFVPGGKYDRDGTTAYVFLVRWGEAGGVLYQFAVDDKTDKIAGFFTRPAPPPPKVTGR